MDLPYLTAATIIQIRAFELAPQDNLQKGWGNSRPAWLIETPSGNMVLKAEMNTRGAPRARLAADSARWGGELMARVSPEAKPQMLTSGEIDTLKTIPAVFCYDQKNCDYIRDISSCGMFIFYKMKYVDNLRDAEKMINSGKVDKLIGKLKEEETMVQLGRIIAVDMFNGNEDRFDKDGRIVNMGNIIFQKDLATRSYKPVGLDFFEAQGAHSSVYGTPDATWSGNTLRDHSTIVILARKIVNNLNALNPNGLQLKDYDLFNLNKGITEGANTLKTYLIRKTNASQGRVMIGRQRGGAAGPRALPAGLTRKMEHLGWL